MEFEGSLPFSQEPSNGPYPEPGQSNPFHPILSPRSILILSSHNGFLEQNINCFNLVAEKNVKNYVLD
jgi:hypothetical protein